MSAKIWYQLVNAATGGPFAHTRASAVRRIRVFDIQDFCAEVYAKDLKRFQSLIESQLRVFKNRDAFNKQHEPLEPSDLVSGLGEDIEHALIVVIPSLYRGSEIIFPFETLKMVGTQCEARLRVPLFGDTRVHELPVGCTRGSGLELRDCEEPLTLFCRPQFLEQWKEMYRNSVRTYALLWIVGPPGAGKSCTTLAFAYALEPFRWDVIWLHLSYKDKVVNFVWLRGNEKVMCTLEMSTLESQLSWLLSKTSTEKTTILFLDGYDFNMKEEREARIICRDWQGKTPPSIDWLSCAQHFGRVETSDLNAPAKFLLCLLEAGGGCMVWN
ncbi:hypothetical protein PHYSODRAFT_302865 [Phytophthora sojae]|uniref:Uncharacterized protein n=1 Tax=Phytophthora sojae (strain P6497) TaxID=1094619 RepID=G4ZTG6_PHYSP|nr:hypothetical protein PHYSODRAFT_302865 [Phytophthora sojae]EGZ13144.1 hypothetical protein PHYSODRAFT_302865 [Phytophthora sojae]|eukprot:XP_009530573.1 hypothetical protein PHYSODRAFT_302865 [Phytophthora sojae]